MDVIVDLKSFQQDFYEHCSHCPSSKIECKNTKKSFEKKLLHVTYKEKLRVLAELFFSLLR